MEDFVKQSENTMADFVKITEIISTIKLERLPLELQIKTVDAYADFMKAMEKFDSEMKGIIVTATILNRIQGG